MPLVTIIGEKLAIKNSEFIYLGPNNDCRSCKIKTVCFNLKVGRKYKITEIRDKKHSCKIHEGSASVVEVQELPIITTVEKGLPEDEKIDIKNKNCDSVGCTHYEICNIKLPKDKKYIISKVIEDVKCPLDYKLQKVELKE